VSAESTSFDAIVAAYFEHLDAGDDIDPTLFIASHPEHKTRFLDFVRDETDGAGRLLSTSARTWQEDPGKPVQSFGSMPATLGEYQIERCLGRGGMGTVFQARRPTDGGPVALKLLHPQDIPGPASRQRFKREVRAIEKLQHAHIVPLFSTGEDQGRLFLTMKLIDGVTLADVCNLGDVNAQASTVTQSSSNSTDQQHVVSSLSSLSQRSAAECFERACGQQSYFRGVASVLADAADALEAAHEKLVVHRDVKPSNLLLDVDGKLWLTDFGLASLEEDQTAVTRTGELLGTPAYMSPEQAIGSHQATDCRTDIYSLGATLYELATLRKPFRGSRYEILRKVAAGEFVRPSECRPEIPRGLEAIILKAMANQPDERYQAADEFAADLRRFVAGLPVTAKIAGTLDTAARWVVRHPRRSVAGVVAVATVIAAVISLQYLHGQRLRNLNDRLEQNNAFLAETNNRLEQTNVALDQSRSRLQHHLYVADMAAAFKAYAKRDNDSAQQLLRRQLLEEGEPDHRRLEWWLLYHLTRSPKILQLRDHRGAAREARYVGSRREIVSSGDDGTVRRWDASSGETIAVYQFSGHLDALGVSPDGRSFVTGENIPEGINRVAIRDLENGQLMHPLTGHGFTVDAAVFSPDGHWIATGGRYQDILLHTSTGELAGRLTTGSRNEAVAFSPDSRSLAASLQVEKDGVRERSLNFWSVPNLEHQRKVELPVAASYFAVDDKAVWAVVAGSDDFAVVHLPSGASLNQLGSTRGGIRCAAISMQGDRFAIGCDNGLLYLWELENVDPETLSNHVLPPPMVISTGTQKVTSVRFMEGGIVLTSHKNGSIQTWETAKEKTGPRAIDFSVVALDQSSEAADSLFLRNEKGEIARLDWQTLETRVYSGIDADKYAELAVSPDGQTLIAAAPGELVVMALPSGRVSRRFATETPDRSVCDICFLPGGEAWLALFDDSIDVYNAADGTLLQHLQLPVDGADDVVFSPDGKTLLVTTRNQLLFLDANSRDVIAELPCTLGQFTHAAAFSEDGRWLAVGHEDGTVVLIDIHQPQGLHTPPRILRGHRSGVNGCMFVAQDQTLVTIASDQTMRFWDIRSGRELGALGPGEAYHFLVHDPLRQQLLTAGPHGPTQLWSTQATAP